MADDGMLLNFAVDNVSFKPQAKIKGGTWKDRLVAKRLARHRGSRAPLPLSGSNQQKLQPRKPRQTGANDDGDFPQPRVAKRRRQEGDFRSDANFVPSSKPQDEKRNGPPQAARGDRPVISSLFSYNPKPSTAPTDDKEEQSEPAKPSNAPLIDGLDTFTSLGLSETLAAHLLTKLGLKDPTAIQKASITQLLQDDADAFIQSETGSGKTLAYLLPLVQRIMNLKTSIASNADGGSNTIQRDSGLFAIVLAPTRELCKQISVVLERVLGCAHWIVAGTVIGGEKKKSEKARLRKGLNILVATPGRLADHLDNTKVLDISKVRWLVLDEGDRLMDLGFEEEIQKIVAKLDERQRPSSAANGLPQRRTTILCSATMKMNVQRLGEISLKDANLIKGEGSSTESTDSKEQAFLAPAQLQQSYSVVAAKLRLVTLVALLKRTFARKGSVMKAIVFVSCADSVDFHFEMLSQKDKTATEDLDSKADSKVNSKANSNTKEKVADSKDQSQASTSISPAPLLSSPANPLTLYKLHGSLPQSTRTAIVNTFARSTEPSLLISTDVASRGLDLPNLDLVIEYDPAFSSEDHLHRIGRTARLGRDGRAMIFLLPGEEEAYVEVLRQSYRDAEGARALTNVSADEMLKRGFAPQIRSAPLTTAASTVKGKTGKPSFTPTTGSGGETWEEAATNLQLEFERLVLASPQHLLILARRAYQSHIRAYATHTASERKYFNIKSLHLGHLAKSFGLRDRPSGIGIPGRTSTAEKGGKAVSGRKRNAGSGDGTGAAATGGDDDVDTRPVAEEEAELRRKKMRAKMRETMLMGAGAGEFNIA